MALKEYQKKRDFKKTREPEGEVQTREKAGSIYVIQRHDASHLHYDLRLERDGVLKSWAVPKKPPTQKGIKRLAVETEDHPIEYAGFEGVISEGEYGAGTVEIWDKGTYEIEKWHGDQIIIRIDGSKLDGRYCLIKFRKQKDAWLFFKS
ncbi:MAG: 3'-phosphoesterase [Candidatus Bathyarchaeota archaeon]|nr:3'-phosphoesterase [Candidatus Bathyarchaeota archaeon]